MSSDSSRVRVASWSSWLGSCADERGVGWTFRERTGGGQQSRVAYWRMRDDTGKPDAIKRRIGARFLQARFFVGALLFHVVFLIFATKIVVDAIQSGEHTFKPDTLVIGNPTPMAPDGPVGKTIRPSEFDASPKAGPGSTGPKPGELIIGVMTDAPKGMGLAMAPDGRSLRTLDDARTLDASPKFGKLDRKQLNAIDQIRRTWFIGPERGYGSWAPGFHGTYRTARGGRILWRSCGFGEDNRQIIGGSVPNLAEMMNRFSRAASRRVQGEVLWLDSREILKRSRLHLSDRAVRFPPHGDRDREHPQFVARLHLGR